MMGGDSQFFEKLVTSAEKVGTWADENPGKVYRIQCVIGAVAGVVLMIFTYAMGHTQFELALTGVKTQGKVVNEERVRVYGSSLPGGSISGYRPTVEFQAGNSVVRFKDWLAGPTTHIPGENIPVLYNGANPAIAVIDRGGWNWVPWGGAFIFALFVLASSIKSWWKSRRSLSEQ